MMGAHHHAFVQGKGNNSKPTVPAVPPIIGTADMCFLYQTPAIIEYAFPIANAAKIDRHIVATTNLRRTMARILRPKNRLPRLAEHRESNNVGQIEHSPRLHHHPPPRSALPVVFM